MADLVWTANFVVFASLFIIWNKDDLFNLSLKVLFAGLAFVNVAPVWKFLERAF